MRGSASALLKVLYLAAAGSLIVGACSSPDDSGSDSRPATSPVTVGSDDEGGDEQAEGYEAGDYEVEVAQVSTTSVAEPARRVPSQLSLETSHWLGVNTMTAEAIELVWSEVDGDDVVYQIFRFESVDSPDPAEVELEIPLAEVVGELSLLDNNVATGQFYTYVMRVIADGRVLERRFTQALAVTDTTPPTPVVGLTAQQTADGVLLEWEPSSDNVEFGSYGVFRLDQAAAADSGSNSDPGSASDTGPEPQYIGGGGDQAVTTFVDDETSAGQTIRYEVVAFDFHGNRSAPASIAVTIK